MCHRRSVHEDDGHDCAKKRMTREEPSGTRQRPTGFLSLPHVGLRLFRFGIEAFDELFQVPGVRGLYRRRHYSLVLADDDAAQGTTTAEDTSEELPLASV